MFFITIREHDTLNKNKRNTSLESDTPITSLQSLVRPNGMNCQPFVLQVNMSRWVLELRGFYSYDLLAIKWHSFSVDAIMPDFAGKPMFRIGEIAKFDYPA